MYISVRFGDVERYEKVSLESDAILRLYDIKGDSWLELLYEQGDFEPFIDIYQLKNEDVDFVQVDW